MSYRLYSDNDLLRLQQIMIGRELGLALDEVRRLLDDPTHDRRALLTRQRTELLERLRDTQAMLRSIDAALAMLDPQQTARVATVDAKQLFEGFDPAKISGRGARPMVSPRAPNRKPFHENR